MHLDLVTVVVADYDDAITFFVDVLGFELAEDSPATTNDGRLKRWVVVRPPGGGTGLLLAEADGSHRARAIGSQARRPRLLLPARRRPRAHVRALDAGPVMAVKVSLEYDGAHHFASDRQRRSDNRRRTGMADHGWLELVAMSEDCFSEPWRLLDRIRRVLRERGLPAVPDRLDRGWREVA